MLLTGLAVAGCVGRAPAWPVLRDRLPPFDTTRLVASEEDSTFFFYRTDVSLFFYDHVTDAEKAAFFKRRGLTVLGVTFLGKFFVRIPDPGPTDRDLFAAVERLREAPEVETAAVIPRSPLEEVGDGNSRAPPAGDEPNAL